MIAFENYRISYFEGLVTLTLTLDWVTLHTAVHQSSTSNHMPNFIEIEKTFLWTDGHTYARTKRQTFETGFIRSTLSKSRPNKAQKFDCRLTRRLNAGNTRRQQIHIHHVTGINTCNNKLQHLVDLLSLSVFLCTAQADNGWGSLV